MTATTDRALPADGRHGARPRPALRDAALATTAVILHTDDVERTRTWMADRGFDVNKQSQHDGGGVTIDIGAVHLTDPFPPISRYAIPTATASW